MVKAREQLSQTTVPYHKIIGKYSARWQNGANDDQTKVTEEQRKLRQEKAAEVAEEYYEFATDPHTNGWSSHFHYTPYAPNESTLRAQAFYEHKFAYMTGLKPGMKVLDVGCGVGAPAREIAKFIGCEIVGVAISQYQINRAIQITAQEGMSHLCTFIRANFLDLPFPDHSFDAAYAIEATCHGPSYAQVYAEISRVLKPNAPFGLSEWVLTPNFNTADPEHIRIRNRVERGNSVPNLDKSDVARAALIVTGFEIFHEEDYAQHWHNTLRYPTAVHDSSSTITTSKSKSKPKPTSLPTSQILIPYHTGLAQALPPTHPVTTTSSPSQALRPWTFTLQGRTDLASDLDDYWRAWRMKASTRRISRAGVQILEFLRVFPKGTCEMVDTIAVCVDGVVEGAEAGLFSPCWWFLCRKIGQGLEQGRGEGIGGSGSGSEIVDAEGGVRQEREGIVVG